MESPADDESSWPNHPPRRWRPVFAVALACVVGAGAGWWAAVEILTPQARTGGSEAVTAEIREATVSRELDLNAVARRPATLVGRNAISGTVTRLGARDQPVDVGSVLYEVDEHPVIAVGGVVPFYREMAGGMVGEDIRQLQAALVVMGHSNVEPDGHFGASTGAAVRSWQESLGVEVTGRVTLGTLVAIDGLPRIIDLEDAIQVGARVGGGEPAVDALASVPEFVVPLSADQLQMVRVGSLVEVVLGVGPLPAEVTEIRRANGEIELVLEAPTGGPVCGDRCDELIPAQVETVVPAKVVVVPAATGPAVPEPAVRSHPDGRTSVEVRSEDGTFTHVDVVVRAAADGLVVVDGVEVGSVVLIGEEP